MQYEREKTLKVQSAGDAGSAVKSVGSSAEQLKARFKDGTVPLAEDFAELIDMAEAGRRAVAKAPDQSAKPDSALQLDKDGGLGVKIKASAGLKAEKNGLSLKLRDSSLLVDTSGLTVNKGSGLSIDNGKLNPQAGPGTELIDERVNIKTGKGIYIDPQSQSVAIERGNGFDLNESKLKVKSANITINVGPEGISVNTGWGMLIGSAGLDIHLKPDGGLECSEGGVSVKIGDGVKIENNNLTVEPAIAFYKGQILTSVATGKDLKTNNCIKGWEFYKTDKSPEYKNGIHNRDVLNDKNLSDSEREKFYYRCLIRKL